MANELSGDEVQFRVTPYQFEHVVKRERNKNDTKYTEASESTSTSSDFDPEPAVVPPVNEWCSCGHCSQMPSVVESRCCHSFPPCEEKRGNLDCVTLHEGFIVNCLNTHVLDLAFYDYLTAMGQWEMRSPFMSSIDTLRTKDLRDGYGTVWERRIGKFYPLVWSKPYGTHFPLKNILVSSIQETTENYAIL